jgi:hypothetical protein
MQAIIPFLILIFITITVKLTVVDSNCTKLTVKFVIVMKVTSYSMKILLIYHTVLLIVAAMAIMVHLIVLVVVNVKNSIPWFKVSVKLIVLLNIKIQTCSLLITMLTIANVVLALCLRTVLVQLFVLSDG